MKRQIAIVGAFDRNNYGDILMPIVFKRYFEKKYKKIFSKYELKFYGLQDSKMAEYGGYDTNALSNIYNNNLIDYAIVIGGDTLPCRYGNMYIHLIDDPKKVKKYQFYDRYFRFIFEKYAKKKLNCLHVRPWILDLEKYNIKTIYNTIGGLLTKRKLLFHKREITDALKNSLYLSVRDNGTKKYLDDIEVKNKLYPDSVTILSEVINKKDFNDNVSNEIKKIVSKYKKYIVIQISEAASKNEIDNIASQIEEFYYKTGMKCILLPIGRASGHSDQIPLLKIIDKVNTPIYMPDSNNVFETAYIIKNSKLFCGTSLHGIITSISYCVPHMALTNKIGKLIRFINTWDTTPVVYTKSNEILKKYQSLMNIKNLKTRQKKKQKELIKLVKENFDNIYQIIK